ncbi:MAG: RagB/SusD family nutrient uptake outer membrane protein [Tannerella sp.]|jgi:hypothetical protein|nr:RagB/SusD family nutrient uptake outer membrane protein [Tannerella sp.]
MKIIFKRFLLSVLALGLFSCDYLDVIPDNVPTVDHAFRNRNEAEGFFYGCFSFMPNFPEAGDNPALLGGDEVWYIDPINGMSTRLWYIAQGAQGTNTPLANYWASKQNEGSGTGQYGLNGGKALFTALSDCNIFLENIDKPFDLEDYERTRWVAEIKFLKAYLHFWLFRMYGPIPLIKENIPVSEKGDASMRYREPVDEVVEYIVSLLDEAFDDLPVVIENLTTELGRPTQTIALALKAQVLTYAASPLFNGTAEEPPAFSLIDNRSLELFPQTYDAGKWQRAAEALKAAIDFAHENGHRLYDFRESSPMTAASLSDATVNSMQVRGAVTERMNNPEMIWADFSSNTGGLQQACFPRITGGNNAGQKQTWAPPLHIVKQFYTKNGVPIEEDRDWVGVDLLELRTATDDERFYTQPNQQTLQLHFDREDRFYASILFNRGRLFGCGRVTDGTLWHYYWKNSGGQVEMHTSTGYLCKKMLNYLSSVGNDGTALSIDRYPFPLIRLADLYLMYAEALNEAGSTPSGEVYQYVDLVRRRSGLNGVTESWSSHSLNPDKPLTKAGMRDIIRRERMIEFAFEGIRFWDLRRWKLTEQYMNQTVQGFEIVSDDVNQLIDVYRLINIYPLRFEKKDYFWPIRQSVLLTNKNLVQNPGW